MPVTRAQFILNDGERIEPVVAHRPGFRFPTDYARHVLSLVRQELAHRAASGTAPILSPDSTPPGARTP